MKPTNEQCLLVLTGLLKRAPMSDAEGIGAQLCIDQLKTATDELVCVKKQLDDQKPTD